MRALTPLINFFNIFISFLRRNEVLAREGIDTIISSHIFLLSAH